MDNIIKIILRQTGGLAELIKTIPLYVGMYNTAVLDVYVPESLVSENISVKVGAILTANDGTKATTDSIPMAFKENTTLYGQNYSVYELNPFPANFLSYAGIQDLVVNIVTLENEEVDSVVTTQISKIDVLDSSLIPDEELSTSAVDQFNARITANEQNISTNTENIGANTEQIAQNVLDIAQNSQDIADIQQNYTTNENPVGSIIVTTLTGIETVLNNYVQQVMSRAVAKGDVVMVTLEISGQTDEIYKYFYTASGWKSLKMPAFESASNTDKGIIQGTLGENKNTQVDITGGKVNAIYVKDANGVLRDIREYANTTKQSIDSIISGATKVGYSQKTDNDANNNNIVDTYLTKNAGVTKTEMREYALPREFNDIYYLGKDGTDTIISNQKPATSLTWSESVVGIGTHEILSAEFISNASFELSQKNSYQAVFYASSSVDKTCQFRIDVKYDNVTISTDLSNEFVMIANNVYKVQFNENFNALQDVINYDGTKTIEVVFSIVSTDSGTATITTYTNSTYISTFNLNTNKYTIETQSGYLGEIVEINVAGTLDNGIATFEIDRTLYNNTLIKFVLSYEGGTLNDYIKFVDSATSEEYFVKTPYNTNGRPQVKDLLQTSVEIAQNLVNIEFVGLVSIIEGYGTQIEVNMDNLTSMGGTTVFVNNVAQSTVNFSSDPQTQITGLGTRVTTLENSGFVTNTVNNLTNYYLKSETYTQAEIDALVAGIKTVTFEIVQTLPTASATTYFNVSKTVYLVRNTASSGTDYYEEYITIRTGTEGNYTYSWEKIGDTQIDLSNYYTKTETDTLLANKQDKITSVNLLDADLVIDTHSYNKFVSINEKMIWNEKQDALSNTQLTNINNVPNKLDKVNNSNKIYATDSNGDQTTIEYGSTQTNSANKIVQRDSNGDVLVPATPTSNNGATSKSYVDSFVIPTTAQNAQLNDNIVDYAECKYIVIGKIVIVYIFDLSIKSDVSIYNDVTLFSGLPRFANGSDHLFMIRDYNNTQYFPIRCKMTNTSNGMEIRTHYSNSTSVGQQGNGLYATLIYIKE